MKKREIKYMSQEERFLQWTKIVMGFIALTLFAIYIFVIM
jgi:hypothetical protein